MFVFQQKSKVDSEGDKEDLAKKRKLSQDRELLKKKKKRAIDDLTKKKMPSVKDLLKEKRDVPEAAPMPQDEPLSLAMPAFKDPKGMVEPEPIPKFMKVPATMVCFGMHFCIAFLGEFLLKIYD